MASRRRRRKSIGKVIVDVERRVRRVEKRPGAKRLKTNVVTTEKLGYRAVTTKVMKIDAVATENIATDAVTPNEVTFGTTIVSDTEPTEYLKEGTTWVNPDDGTAKVYDPTAEEFFDVSAVDATARASADGKNTIYRQDAEPTGGTYVTGDTWFDSNDNNKIYRYNGTSFVALQLGGNALANISANSVNTGTLNANLITVSNLDVGTMTTGNLSATRISAGTISASISITAPTITSGGLTINADGSITTSTGNFGLSTTGVVTATGVDITGEINATSGTFSGTITATGTISGGTISGSTITGSLFTSTNYAAGSGIAIASGATGETILFSVAGAQRASIATVAGGMVLTSGASTLTLSYAGSVQLTSTDNALLMSAAPYFMSGSGANTSGGLGSIRNTWASSSDPGAVGSAGDVWLKWA